MSVITNTNRQLYPVDGNGAITIQDILDSTEGGDAEEVTVDTLAGATAVGKSVMKATDAAAARTAIGAGTGNGTSNLALGTTATTAMAGNKTFIGSDIKLTGYVAGTAGNVVAADTTNQAIAKLEARIAALEAAGA